MNLTQFLHISRGRIVVGRRKILGKIALICALLLSILALCLYIRYRSEYMSENAALIENSIDSKLSYKRSDRQSDFDYLNSLLERKYLTNYQKGVIYEQISILHHLSNSPIQYYKNAGYAQYYLERAGDYDRRVNIYCDLSNYYMEHDAYFEARNMLNKASAIIGNGNKMRDYSVYSNYFRMFGQVETSDGNYEEAHEYFEKSRNKASYIKDKELLDDTYAKIDVQEALCYVLEGDARKAKILINKYKPKNLTASDLKVQREIADYQLPYYETLFRLARLDNDFDSETHYVNSYTQYCVVYNMYQKRLDIWNLYSADFDGEDIESIEHFSNRIRNNYKEITKAQSEDYVKIVDISLGDSMNYIETYNKEEIKKVISRFLTVLVAVIIFSISFTLTKIYKRSMMDNLTGVYNRAFFDKNLGRYIERGDMFSAIMIDIDDFKKINDQYGHESGDYVLKKLGGILSTYKSRYTKPYRYGGEEFIILTEIDSPDKVVELAEKIRHNIEVFNWQQNLSVTVSVGVARHCLANEIVKKADNNLYYTKKHGKNNVCYSINEKEVLLNA